MSTTAIIPAFNEEVSIGSIVVNTRKYVDHVIVVNDGSKDNTAEIASLTGAEVITHERKMGKGVALKTGFSVAVQNGTNILVTLDADGQHDPREIPKIIEPILKKEADMVIGNRYLNGNEKNTPFYRRLGQKIIDYGSYIIYGKHITDTQSGFRAFAIHTVPVFGFESKGFEIESEMLEDALREGLKIKEVEIGVRYDVDCSTENPLVHGTKLLLHILQELEFRKPLYYFTIPGLIIVIFGIGMGLKFLEDFFNGSRLHFGPTLLMILLTLVGMFLTFTGIILHSISRLMEKINKIKKK